MEMLMSERARGREGGRESETARERGREAHLRLVGVDSVLSTLQIWQHGTAMLGMLCVSIRSGRKTPSHPAHQP
jgi:hypothetical protein